MSNLYAPLFAWCKNQSRLIILIAGLLTIHSGDITAQCSNVTWGGQINGTQYGCAGFDPTAIFNENSPSGGSGTMQYMWLYKSASTGWNFQTVSGASSSSYDPGPLNETTTYRRCARRSGCSSWDGESNDVTITVNVCSSCNNLTSGGSISGNQSGCTGFDPTPFTSTGSPSGGSGTLEIVWMYKNASSNWDFVWINNSNSLSYDSGPLSETTTFRRCSRRAGCSDWAGESNDVTVTINTCCASSITSTSIYNLTNGSSIPLTDGATYTSASLPASWNIETIFSGNAESVKFTFSGSSTITNTENTTPFRSPGDATALNLVPGNYTLNVKLYSQDNASGTICDEKIYSFTIVQCDNFTSGGSIAGSQNGCAPYNPTAFTSSSLPSGGTGNTEYVWIYRNASTNNQWIEIPNSNSPTYDSGLLLQTTDFRRCARRSGCTQYTGESNIITITINGNCTPTEVCDLYGYEGINGRIFWIPAFGTDFKSSSSNPMKFEKYPNGVAHIVGTVERISNSNHKFNVSLWYEGQSTFMQWLAQGLSPHSPDLGDESTWTFYKFSTTLPNTLTGQGSLAGVLLNLTNQNPIYGLQLGNGANALTTANNGLSVWFNYTGTHTGNGDINATFNCPPVCNNLTNGGTIGTNQSGCAPFNPSLFTNTSLPTGGSGTIQYLWEYRNAETGNVWTAITGATSATYDSGPINITTEFRRTSRRSGCTEYAGLSNVLTVSIDNVPPVFQSQQSTYDLNCGEQVPLITPVATDNVGVVSLTYINNSNCQTAASPCNFKTYTQGGWGSKANGNNPGSYRNANFAAAFPNGLTIGCAGGNTLKLTTSAAVEAFLPSGSTPSVLNNNYLNPGGTYNNIFAGQLVALTLNVVFDAYDPNFAASGGTLGSQIIASGPFANMTINQLITAANQVIGGCSNTYSPSALNSALTSLNENFDAGCNKGFVNCSEPDFSCSCTHSRIWTAKDACGNSTVFTQTFLLGDNEPPIANTIPADITIQCSQQIPAPATVVFSDECGTITEQYFAEDSLVISNCSTEILRTWVASDGCNLATVTQKISIIDTTAPILVGVPADITLECGQAVPEAVVSATDNCTVELVVGLNVTTENLPCGYKMIRTWSTTDDCGNTASKSQIVTMVDNTDPVLTNLPENGTVLCGALPLPSAFNVGATDNCLAIPVVTSSYNDEGSSCNITRTITWSATDACGNEVSASRTFVTQDLTDPVLSNVPTNAAVLCGALPSEGDYDVTASDNCDTDVTITSSFIDDIQGCNIARTITWTATDDCGNEVSASATFTSNDTTQPVLIGVPADITLECGQAVPEAVVSATDNCTVELVVGLNVTTENLPCGYKMIRTWSTTDDCGNTASKSQNIIMLDNTAPALMSEIPAQLSISCELTQPAFDPVFSDNCIGDITVDLNESIINQTACSYDIKRVWTATDRCNNSTITNQIIHVYDNTAPVFASVPGNQSVDCGNIPAAADLTATDNCSAVEIAMIEEISTGCPYTITRIWTATDECGNSAEHTQIIEVTDTTNPVLSNLPLDHEAQCGTIPAVANVQVTDNCDDNITVIYSENIIHDSCPVEITRTWTATDVCGNSVSHTQHIIISDTTPPVVIAPEDTTGECSQVPTAGEPEVTDNCDSSPSVTSSEQIIPVDDCTYTIVRTWTATDDCGNSSSASQTLQVTDTTPPGFSNVPADVTINCNEIPNAAAVLGVDNCDADVEITMVESISTGCPYTITRTWTGVDNCGNEASVTQVLTVEDNQQPVLYGVPQNMTISCTDNIPDVQVYAIDNCDENITLSIEANTTEHGCESIFTRTWTATDVCGNTTTATQFITITDTEYPIITQNVDSEITIECDETIPSQSPVFSDNCDDELEITFTSENLNQTSCGYEIHKKWTATDNCGNITEVNQKILIRDTTNPVISGVPSDATVICTEIPTIPSGVTATDNCDQNVSITFDENTTANPSGCGYSIIRTWTATDDCGNSSSASQTLNVIDTEAPELIGVPADTNAECDAIPAIPWVNAIDNCNTGEMLINFGENIVTISDCEFHIIRTWSTQDNCGNFVSDSQTITITDQTNPQLQNVPENITVSCTAIPSPANITATDNCDSDMAISFEEITSDGCPYTITRRWSVTDDCNNSAVAEQIITVIDNIAPSFSSTPQGMTVSCDNIPTVPALTVTDNCDTNAALEYEEIISEECPYTITRRWTATDNCGNEAEIMQVINVIDNAAPELFNIPADASISCSDQLPSFEVYATDNCTENPVVSLSAETTTHSCGSTIVRTWTATDNCGNTVSKTQTITLTDTTSPQFTTIPENTTISCESDPEISEAIASDNCDSNVEITMSDSVGTGCPYVIYRTWIAADDCGNQSSVVQQITVVDEVDPQLQNVPQDATVECTAIPAVAQVTATDNCDAEPAISFSESVQNQDCGSTIIRTWTATDACGNTTTQSQTIQVIDSVEPHFIGIPENTTVSCNEIPAVATVTVGDNCDQNIAIQFDEVIGEGCPYTITRTWSATDDCGNNTTATQIISVYDNENPQFTGIPQNTAIECHLPVSDAFVTASDNCSSDMIIDFSETEEVHTCGKTITRTWSVTDHCGNTTTQSQTIEVVDTTAPQLQNVPANTTVTCDAIPSAPEVTATDNCQETLTVTMSEIISEGCPYTITRTWTTTDICGNTTEATQVIEVIDEENPVLVGVPANANVSCDNIPFAVEVTAEDNCSDNLNVTFEEQTQITDACTYQIIRTWSAVDNCGNQTTEVQVLTVSDTTDPVVLTSPMPSMNIECDEQAEIIAPTFSDNCDSDLSIQFIEGISNENNCGYDLERTWIATDNCGNSASFTQIVHVTDTTAPVLAGIPADLEVSCDNVPAPSMVYAEDNCDVDVMPALEESVIQNDCGYEIVRTWTAMDDCGNSASASQHITVVDTVDPVAISVPADVELECGSTLPIANAVFTDNCDSDLSVNITTEEVQNVCGYTIFKKWTATDDCGNSTSMTQEITIVDTTKPVLIGVPENQTVSCDAVTAAPVVTATDNCSANLQVEYAEHIGEGCPYIITRTWRATDDCGNSMVESQLITVIDDVDPVIAAPSDITVECNQIPTPEAVEGNDNCDSDVSVTMTEHTEDIDNCSYKIIRTYTATDNCGNQSSDAQVITVTDNIAPVLNGVPQNTTVACNSIPAAAVVTANDNCSGSRPVVYSQTIGDGCPYTIERRWTSADACGNEVTATQLIMVIDEQQPTIINMPDDLTIECNGTIPPASTAVTGVDNCSITVTITSHDEVIDNECGYQIKRTFTAADLCGNTTTEIQMITVIDETNPVFMNIPVDLVINCNDAIPAADEAVSANDNCDNDVEITVNDMMIPQECGYQIKRYYTATDDCGNSVSVPQTITVVDETSPSFNSLPQDITVNCESIPAPEELGATDNCDNDVEISYNESIIASGCPYQIKRIWTATDNCGNTQVATQTVTVIDEILPSFDPFPVFVEVECDQLGAYTITASDNCDSDVEVTVISELEFSGACYGTVQRIYEATDNCGNSVTAIQLINLIDTSPPVLYNVPYETFIQCNDELPEPPQNIIAEDNCTDEVTVHYTETQTSLNCPYNVIRTWTATDDCGNTTTRSQTIHVIASTAPIVYLNAFPNPATTGEIRIQFSVPHDAYAKGGVYDIAGKEVISLIAEQAIGGTQYNWSLNSKELSAGSYTISLMVDGEQYIKRIMIMNN